MNALKKSVVKVLDQMLPSRAKEALLHLSYHLTRSEFEKYAFLYERAPNMQLGLAAIAARGFQPRTVIDVGAFEGGWSRMAREIWPKSDLILIEPNLSKRDGLIGLCDEIDASLLTELLGAEEGREVPFSVMGSGSSVMPELSGRPREVVMRQLRTLDGLLGSIQGPAFLKIDAQGYELEILRGATAILPSIHAVLLEVALIEINKGAPLIDEVLGFMKSLGFVSYEVLELHRRPLDKAMNQVDIFFVREDSALIADKRHYA